MHRCLAVLLLVFAANASPLTDEPNASPLTDGPELRWANFKADHGKSYGTEKEEAERRSLFEENLADITAHNELFAKGLVSYSKAVNKFADMHLSEIIGGGLLAEDSSGGELFTPGPDSVPESKDWRNVPGVVTDVKNQRACGSCWAFATTGTLEGQWKLTNNESISLSEQHLVDCSYKNNGCNGGLMTYAYSYIHSAGGIEGEAMYPYEAKDNDCYFDNRYTKAKVTAYKKIREGYENDLAAAIATIGPIAVGITATKNLAWYSHGILVDELCIFENTINHGVLAVGYGQDPKSKQNYYIVKNSWGYDWGEQGYFRLAKNHLNMCHIASIASYPLVPKS